MYELERVAEYMVGSWLLFNTLGMVLVAVGVARRYARTAAQRREERNGEVAFEQALPLPE